eukprot:6295071-Prymnesium_polylepis.3
MKMMSKANGAICSNAALHARLTRPTGRTSLDAEAGLPEEQLSSRAIFRFASSPPPELLSAR